MQCEDRCHRIGQKNSVSVYWLQWHEIDQKIDTILEQKQERIELILEGKRKTLRGIGSPADIAQELCEDILAKGKKKSKSAKALEVNVTQQPDIDIEDEK